MEGYSQINKEDLELLERVLSRQGYSFEEGSLEPSLEERARIYNKAAKIIHIFGCISSVVLAAVIPLKDISFATFVVLLFASRFADILSTILCLRMPWTFESNPQAQTHRLNGEFIFKYLLSILFCAGVIYLLSFWLPVLARGILLIYIMAGFVVATSNLYQTFALVKASILFYVISNSLIGVGIFFLLRVLI